MPNSSAQVGSGPSGLGEMFLRFMGSPDPIREIRALSPLPDEAQRLIDTAVVNVGLDNLTFVADLMESGLTTTVPNWLSVMELYWERLGPSGRAKQSMIPNTRGEGHHTDRDGARLPIYVTWDDFSFNIRLLAASERAGQPLNTDEVDQATRNVNELIEYSAIHGAGLTVNGNGTPGLLTAPNAATFPITESWLLHTGPEIVDDVQDMAGELDANGRRGPYNLYVPTPVFNHMQNDYTTGSANTITILQRLEMLKYGSRNLRVRPAQYMTSNKVTLVQMTREIVDVAIGQEPVPIKWMSPDGFTVQFLILACIVPRVRDDYEGKSGICIGTW